MEGELKEFHKTNTQLELKIAELNLKLKTKDKELHKEMRKVSMCTALDIFRVHAGSRLHWHNRSPSHCTVGFKWTLLLDSWVSIH